MNDTQEELENWLYFNKKNNIELLVLDIENSWLSKYREDKPDEKILDLMRYVETKAKEMEFFRFELCDRAKYLL